MMRKIAAAVALGALIACAREADDRADTAAPDGHAAAPAEPEAGSDGQGAAAPAAGRPTGAAGSEGARADPAHAKEDDACGAARYQGLVGRPRSEIPPQPAGATWRIACTGCPITMDHAPHRLNIFYNQETERIEEVRCG